MHELVGKSLGQYQILQFLGTGAMAEIYLAYQPSVKREVAVKVLVSMWRDDPSFVKRFEQEVEIIAHLQHPFIVPVYDFGEQGDLLYIVMAYLRGGTLAKIIHESQGGLPVQKVIQLVKLISSGLDYAHSKGILHRDLKPNNILLDEFGNPYIADFGIAKNLEGKDDATNTIMTGTAAYMAPETAQTGRSTKKGDIYALGIILFEMLTGKVPYMGKNPYKVLSAHVHNAIPNLLEIRPELPVAFQTIVEKVLAKNPEERFNSATELADALQMV